MIRLFFNRFLAAVLLCPISAAAAMLVRTYERYTAKADWLHGLF